MRLFVAIELPDRVRGALAAAIDDLRSTVRGPFRWVGPDGIHLTLKFLGDVPETGVEALVTGLAGASLTVQPLELHLEGAGTFPPGRPPSVVWAGLGGDLAALNALCDAVEAAMAGAGMSAETRTFRPHLTLARVRGRLGREATEALDELLGA